VFIKAQEVKGNDDIANIGVAGERLVRERLDRTQPENSALRESHENKNHPLHAAGKQVIRKPIGQTASKTALPFTYEVGHQTQYKEG